ncbi:hypothetical protein CC80DRAFT_97653 [Byssothecium circinans]|uniref:Secreted protein n=1 Tax=Byssothecium circinans TaxID=147558 RepID=A0A6A5UEP2_9PLEO|nr:hypothetical protein CC80DRAFT_97653 [Byssothecium circinans]
MFPVSFLFSSGLAHAQTLTGDNRFTEFSMYCSLIGSAHCCTATYPRSWTWRIKRVELLFRAGTMRGSNSTTFPQKEKYKDPQYLQVNVSNPPNLLHLFSIHLFSIQLFPNISNPTQKFRAHPGYAFQTTKGRNSYRHLVTTRRPRLTPTSHHDNNYRPKLAMETLHQTTPSRQP